MMSPHASWDQPRTRRVVGLVAVGLAVEAALLGVVKLAPAMGTIMHPVYVVVAVLFALAIWHSGRRRTERRHGERRHAAPRE